MLHTLILSLVLFQTRVNQEKQTFGSNIIANNHYYKATFMNDGRFQLLPGFYFNQFMKIQNVTPPPNSQAVCGRNIDGETHPAYEFASSGDVILTEDSMFICTPLRKWRKVRLDEF